MSLDRVEPYAWVRVVGTVRKLRIDPAEGTLEATVDDSGAVATARWGLVRPLRQLRAVPGSVVLLEGVAEPSEAGGLRFNEPRYTILSESEPK